MVYIMYMYVNKRVELAVENSGIETRCRKCMYYYYTVHRAVRAWLLLGQRVGAMPGVSIGYLPAPGWPDVVHGLWQRSDHHQARRL